MITVVSGLPRCGTSLMMQMLDAGGMPVLTDHVRRPDADNPRGYYELEAVKRIARDSSWLADAEGKAFKMVSMLLYELPAERTYRIVFMTREMEEILASQRRMLERMDNDMDDQDDAEMRAFFESHLAAVRQWLAAQPNMEVLPCSFNVLVRDPAPVVQRIAAFLGHPLDTDRMTAVVDPSLYRQRRTS